MLSLVAALAISQLVAPPRGELQVAAPYHALTPEKAVLLALADADALAVEDQPFQLYLFRPHASAQDEAEFTTALRLQVNMTSREPAFSFPVVVVPGLYRVDSRNYQWPFDKIKVALAGIDPYFHRNQDVVVVRDVVEVVEEEVLEYWPGGIWPKDGIYYYPNSFQVRRVAKKEVKKRVQERVKKRFLYAPQAAGQLAALALLLQSDAPIVRADWFLVQSARQTSLNNRDDTGAGYFDFLGLKTQDDFFKLIGLNEAAAQRNELRAVINKSGVTQNNRQIVIQGAETGRMYQTLEVNDQSGRGIAINNLRRGEFVAVASEFYGTLPNGLPATFLANAQGERQSSVPDKIATNRAALNVSNDGRVHVNISCFQCHAGAVLQPFQDEVRKQYVGRLGTFANDKNVDLELRRAYGGNLARIVSSDQQRYQDTLTQVTGKAPALVAALYSKAFTDYAYNELSVASAARELGVTDLQLRKALGNGAQRLARGDFRFDAFLLDTPGTVPRLTFEDSFQAGQDTLYGVLDPTNPTAPKE